VIFHGAPDLYNSGVVTCPLCRQRKPRRACPAIGQEICPVCCGTKRLVEIPCPGDCPYLASAREHPPARIVRQQEDDLGLVVRFMQDFDDRQSQLFFVMLFFLARYSTTPPRHPQPSAEQYLTPDLQPPIDEDVTEAFAALAATYETASRGVLYEHRPQSPPAGRLVDGLKPLLAEAGKGGGSAFQREAAIVLRRVETAARQLMKDTPGSRRAFLDLVGRVVRAQAESDRVAAKPSPAPNLIIP
jgi:hypothetical protein